MRRSKNTPDISNDLRPKMNMSGVAKLMNVNKATLYRHINRELFSLAGVPMLITRSGNLYDMEGVFQKVFPSADGNKIADLMYDFMRENRGLVK